MPELPDAIRSLAEPVAPPVGARDDIVAAVDARRRRHRLAAAGLTALVVAAVVGSVVLLGGGPASVPIPPSDVNGPSPSWTRLAEAPLAARHDSVGAWTGSEVIVVGGSSGSPCPPNADCAGQGPDSFLRDGAAYDPATDAWRRIPDAPRAFAGGLTAWTGREVIVLAPEFRSYTEGEVTLPSQTFAFDPQANTWRELDRPPAADFNQAVVTDFGVVFGTYDQPKREGVSDWVLDVESGTWSPLPHDPFGESYDRSLAWDGERLWLLSMAAENHFAAHEGAPSRVAVLEGDAWDLVGQTPNLVYEQRWWWFQDRLTVASGSYGDGTPYVFSPSERGWVALPRLDEQGCRLPYIGPSENWLAGGGPMLTSADPQGARAVPPCVALPDPDVGVWAGEELVIWGGPAKNYRGNSNLGLSWTPPAP